MSKAEIANHVVVKPITQEDLNLAGVRKVARVSRKRLEDAFGVDAAQVLESASPEFISCAMSVRDNFHTELEASRRAAIALALMDESGDWQRLTDADGKHFKNFSVALKSIFRGYAEGTIRAYLGAGRTVYLPAARGTLDPALMPLNELGPGTTMFIASALADKEAAPRVPEALKQAVGNASTITQKMVKEAATIAKSGGKAESKPDSDKKSESTEKAGSTEQKRATAAEIHAKEIEATKINIMRYWKPEIVDGELKFTITQDNMMAFARAVKNYSGDGAAARTFFEAMHSLIHPKAKADA